MWDEAFPEMQEEVGVAATEDGDEVILVGLDGAFCGAGAMKVWGDKLEPTLESRRKVSGRRGIHCRAFGTGG